MERRGTVYVLTNLLNMKRYVGITEQPFDKRLDQHWRAVVAGSDLLIHRALRKYGLHNFEVTTRLIPVQLLKAMERRLIELLDSYNNGYNMTLGGEGVSKVRNEEAEEMVKLWLCGYTGADIGNLVGYSAGTVRYVLEQHGINRKEFAFRSHDQAGLGPRKLAQIDFNTRKVLRIWESMYEAGKNLSIGLGRLWSCCTGKSNSAGRYFWRYADDLAEADILNGTYSGDLPETHGSGAEQKYDYTEIFQLYCRNYSTQSIAEQIGCAASTVLRALSLHGISHMERQMHGKRNQSVEVVAIHPENKEILAEYRSMGEAAKELGVDLRAIQSAIEIQGKCCGLYIRKREDISEADLLNKEFSGELTDLKLMDAIRRGKAVEQIDESGAVLVRCYSLAEAARLSGCSVTTIYNAINKGKNKYGKWRYVEEEK